MTSKAISLIERGKRRLSLEEVPRLSKALSVPQAWFIEEDESVESIRKDNFSGIGTNIKKTTEINNVDRLVREISRIPPE